MDWCYISSFNYPNLSKGHENQYQLLVSKNEFPVLKGALQIQNEHRGTISLDGETVIRHDLFLEIFQEDVIFHEVDSAFLFDCVHSTLKVHFICQSAPMYLMNIT